MTHSVLCDYMCDSLGVSAHAREKESPPPPPTPTYSGIGGLSVLSDGGGDVLQPSPYMFFFCVFLNVYLLNIFRV